MTAATGAPHSTWSSPQADALQRFLEGNGPQAIRYRAEAKRARRTRPFPPRDHLADRPCDHQRRRARVRGPTRDRVGEHAGASADAHPGGVSLPRTRRPADLRARGTIPRHPARHPRAACLLARGRPPIPPCLRHPGPAPQLPAARARPPDAAGPAVPHGAAGRRSPAPHPGGRRPGDRGAPHSRRCGSLRSRRLTPASPSRSKPTIGASTPTAATSTPGFACTGETAAPRAGDPTRGHTA